MIDVQDQLIHDLEIPQLKPLKLSQHLVVISGDVVHFLPFRQKVGDVLNYLHVRLRKVMFIELPDIDDIAVKNKCFRVDRFQIIKNFFSPATKSSEMSIG